MVEDGHRSVAGYQPERERADQSQRGPRPLVARGLTARPSGSCGFYPWSSGAAVSENVLSQVGHQGTRTVATALDAGSTFDSEMCPLGVREIHSCGKRARVQQMHPVNKCTHVSTSESKKR